jgi:hypothetical protein
MRGTATNFLELKVLNRLVKHDHTYSAPATPYMGVASAVSSDGDSITELTTSSGYPRKAATFGASSARTSSISASLDFDALPVALNGSVARYYVLFDASTGGNPLLYWRIDTSWNVTAVSTGSKTFTIAGDQTAVLTSGVEIQITGSTGNDGYYTVVSSATSSGNTVVTVSETIPSSTADGSLTGPNPTTLATSDVVTVASSDLSVTWTGDLSVVAANAINDYYLRNQSWPFSSTARHMALFTAQSGDTVTEVSGGGYGRCDVSSHFGSAASAGSIANTVTHLFAKATGSQGTAVSQGMYDASTSGNLLVRVALDSPIAITANKRVRFAVGVNVITLN